MSKSSITKSGATHAATKKLVFSAMGIALAMVTSYIKVWEMPMGGSITLMSMLFICLIGYWFGPKYGLLAGAAYGLLQFIVDPYMLTIPRGNPGLSPGFRRSWPVRFFQQPKIWPSDWILCRRPGTVPLLDLIRRYLLRFFYSERHESLGIFRDVPGRISGRRGSHHLGDHLHSPGCKGFEAGWCREIR